MNKGFADTELALLTIDTPPHPGIPCPPQGPQILTDDTALGINYLRAADAGR